MADRRPLDDVLIRQGENGFHPAIDGGEESFAKYLHRLAFATGHLASLFEQARAEERRLPVAETAYANTNSSGAVTFPIYQVGAGLLLELEHLVLEAATFDGTAYTPAAPWTAGWVGIFASPNPASVAQGMLIDFVPTVGGGGQNVFPQVADYSPPNLVRSQQYLVCYVTGGPTSKRISARMTGHLRANG